MAEETNIPQFPRHERDKKAESRSRFALRQIMNLCLFWEWLC